MRVFATVVLSLGLAAPAHAASFFQSAWGQDVIATNASVGPEVCAVSADCKQGVPAGVGGAFSAPSGVASDGAGDVYVLEEAANRVQKYSSSGVFQRMWGKDVIRTGGSGDTGTGFEVCTVAADCQLGTQGTLGGELSHPKGIAVDSTGNVYVADSVNNRIQEYTSSGGFIRSFGRDVDSVQLGTFEVCTVAMNCKAGVGSPAVGGTLFSPGAVAVDSDGAIYIANGLRRVDRFTIVGGLPAFDRAWGPDVDSTGGTGFEVCTVAANCKVGVVGTGLGGETNLPVGVAVAAGDVYVFGGAGFRVDEYTTSGDFLRAWGKDVVQGGGTAFEVCTVAADCKTGVTGSAGGEFRSPNDLVAPASDGIAVNPSGTTVYVADRENDRLQVFSSDGDFKAVWGLDVDSTAAAPGPQVCTVAANCTAGSQESPLPGGGMSKPTGVAADATGAIYEVDQTAARIQRFSDAVAPDSPVVAATNHGDEPANDNHPVVTGSATPGSTVDLYDNPGCTGAPIGTGTAEQFASPGITATVPDDSITHIYAQATNPAGSSPCSTSSVTYEEISTLRWHVHFGAASTSVSEAAGSITVTISRSGLTDGTASVHYATADGTAGSGDYGAVSGTLKFSPGQAGKTVAIPIINDPSHEPDETFTIALSSPGLGTDTDAPASETITIVDDDPIDTAITAGPSGPTPTAAPTFAFTADPPGGATFACSIDAGAGVACSSPFMTATLADGPHTFSVTASTPGGIADPTPATRGFFVDTVAPVSSPQILGGQRVGQSSTFHGSVLLIASAADPAPSPGGVQTRCAYAGATTPSPVSFDALADGCEPAIVSQPGDYVFYAASRDAAGNVEATVRSVRFTILPGVDVTITSGPSGATWQKQPLFGFTSTTAGATYRCHIDGDPFVTCQSPWLATERGPGDHAFYVKAVAPDGTESTVEARYYTIQAPTNAANEPHGHCAVNPFLVDPDNPNGGKIIGCGFGKCPRRIACSPAIPACPTGALCTLRFTSHFADDDPAIRFDLVYYCQQHHDCLINELNDQWRVSHHFDSVFEGDCLAQVLGDPRACDVSSTETIFGQNRAISPTCSAQIEDTLAYPLKPGDVLTRDLGPDSSRHLGCDATESIAPASALDLANVKPGPFTSYLYVPATGTLTLSPGAGLPRSARVAASAARKRAAPPGITSTKITVKHPGAVALRFHLNQAATRLVARRHKLKLRVKISLQPPHQAAITRTHTVTFTKPAKPPSARQRRRAARRLCLRKYPHQARICNRL